jgi:hypothetical protein
MIPVITVIGKNRLMMKNKFILFALLATSSIFSGIVHEETVPVRRIIRMYHNIPKYIHDNLTALQFSLIYASWAAKYVVYTFDEVKMADIVVFSAYNDDCCFSVEFNHKTNECFVDFNADDNSFNYDSFRNIMDHFLLYD